MMAMRAVVPRMCIRMTTSSRMAALSRMINWTITVQCLPFRFNTVVVLTNVVMDFSMMVRMSISFVRVEVLVVLMVTAVQVRAAATFLWLSRRSGLE